GHDAQERGLPRSVRPDDADLRAEVEGQPDPLQDLALRRDRLAQVLHGVDELGRHQVSTRASRLRRYSMISSDSTTTRFLTGSTRTGTCVWPETALTRPRRTDNPRTGTAPACRGVGFGAPPHP